MNRTARALAQLGLLTATGIGLWWAGGALPSPGPTPEALRSWAGTVDPVLAAFGALRALALVLLGWTVATALVAGALRRARLVGPALVVERLTLPVARRLARGLAGATLVAATMAPGAAFAASTRAPAAVAPALSGQTVVVEALDPVAPTSTVVTAVPPATSPPPDTAPALSEPPPPPSSTAPQPSLAAPITSTEEPDTWRVEPGDHLWHVAEATLARRTGASPDPAAVLDYLEVLVEANRDRLVAPGQPDLVYPGQVFVLPGG